MGGFMRREGAETVIEYMGYIASRNGQDGPLYVSSVLFPARPYLSHPGRSVEETMGRACSLSDLTATAFERHCLDYPRDELEELRSLEGEYRETLIESTRIKLDRELAERKARRE